MKLHPTNSLSAREQEVTALLAEGMSNTQLAETLSVSEQTIKRHMSNIFDKTGLESRLELALWWMRERIPAEKDARIAELEAENASLRSQRDMWRSWCAL